MLDRFRTILLAALAGSLSLAPVGAQDDAFKAHQDRVFAELKDIKAQRERGEHAAATRRTINLCLETPDAMLEQGRTNFACSIVTSDYKGHPLYRGMAQDLCARGSASSCMSLYFQMSREQVDPEIAAVHTELRYSLLASACEAGDGDGCSLYGLAHLTGREVEKNPAVAKAAFALGCERGNYETCSEFLDLMGKYQFGPIENADVLMAAKGACPPAPSGASSKSCIAAAEAVELHGEDEDQHLIRAFLGRACSDFAEAESCFWLAEDYENGDTGPADSTRAKRMLETGCKLRPGDEACA